jgi:hypothetical protein
MEKSGYWLKGRGSWRCVLLLLVMAGGFAGCAGMKSDLAGDTVVRTVWKARDEYVAVARQDRPAVGTAPANAHPAEVSSDRLRIALASIEVLLPGEDEPTRLFNDPELRTLSEHVRTGLASAAPDEDVTFAVIGNHPVLLGMGKKPKVTTGRVFCRDGELNIIFGDLLRVVNDGEDRRLYPFLPGSRDAAPQPKWALKTKAGGEPWSMKRADWLAIPLAGPATPIVSPSLRPDSGAEGSEATHEQPAAAGKKSAAERLKTLIDLRDKKLITEDEYQAKRREILDGL